MNPYVLVYLDENGWCVQDLVYSADIGGALTTFLARHPTAKHIYSVSVYFGQPSEPTPPPYLP